MKILRVAVGNSKEAFIESRFTEGLNIISSDDGRYVADFLGLLSALSIKVQS